MLSTTFNLAITLQIVKKVNAMIQFFEAMKQKGPRLQTNNPVHKTDVVLKSCIAKVTI